jgi:hypothetical protein
MDGWWIRQTLICWVPIPYLTTIGCRSLAFFYCLPLNNTLALTNILFMNSLFFVCSFYFLCDATWWLAKLLLFSPFIYILCLLFTMWFHWIWSKFIEFDWTFIVDSVVHWMGINKLHSQVHWTQTNELHSHFVIVYILFIYDINPFPCIYLLVSHLFCYWDWLNPTYALCLEISLLQHDLHTNENTLDYQ